MYRKLMLAAATATVVAATSFAAAPADASPYRVIRWDGTRLCQVWDFGMSKPVGAYKVLSKKKKTVEAATRTLERRVAKHRCGW